MQVVKTKRKAKIVMSNSKKLNANFFLSQYSEIHSGGETVFDIVNSQNSFIPIEDNVTKDIIFISKDQLMIVELSVSEYVPSVDLNKARIQIVMVNNEKLDGYVLIDTPQIKSRVSDYFNILHQFVRIYQDQSDLILNKAYILSVKEITM